MGSTSLREAETYIKSLAEAGKVFAITESESESSSEVQHARHCALAAASGLQTLLSEPNHFIQRLAHHIQLLSCLQWLGEFQVLAFIPLMGSVSARDVADLAGVPESHLCRIVRLTATAGFLHEPQPGHFAHTPLSAPFVTNLSYLDAVMFLAETAAPAALQMAAATPSSTGGALAEPPAESAYSLAFHTSRTFQSACEQRAKLQRQWHAYLHWTGDEGDAIRQLLSGLDWSSLRNARIVEVGAESTETAETLATLYPALHFVVQLSKTRASMATASRSTGRPGPTEAGIADESGRRISIQRRAPGTPQPIKDGAMYILHLPSSSPAVRSASPSASIIIADLQAHAAILREKPSAMLVVVSDLPPKSGAVDEAAEAKACVRDLSWLQLMNERAMDIGELMDLITGVEDGMGHLVVVNKLLSRDSTKLALCVKYQARWVP
ncbi:hypothetical protein C8A03DRAFT_19340 [Achaetomium macrosporum]|uniref:O-methyltransferase n=1 Tax=Achaetomium macrosporum TaxID=79813 RepID=A0AAN7C1M5_9PEZI|nr:hypothetical protein C8A03DRAFT_19340 [Achaetomium macrosporum]